MPPVSAAGISPRTATGPVLVTGMPRSGTTWLAQVLATASHTALAGREPMNPRGRQYALGGTLSGWCELTDPSPRQKRLLRRAYAARTPWVYSRYGKRQWAAALPGTRLVVKDPFAMLSVPTVVRVTGATAVLLYRHPAAALASYRRMGWTPDLDELAPILRRHRERCGVPASSGSAELSALATSYDSPAEAMGRFWSALYEIALDDIGASGTPVVVVDHEQLASGGAAARAQLFAALGLHAGADTSHPGPATSSGQSSAPGSSGAGTDARAGTLHEKLKQAPEAVAAAWRRDLEPSEIGAVEEASMTVRARLDTLRIHVKDC